MNMAAGEDAASIRERSRSLEEAVSFGLSHRLRIEILAELHDQPSTASRLSRRLRVTRGRLRYHLEEFLNDGSIEVAGREPAGNVEANIYRVTKLAFNSDADWQALSPKDRQEECGVILRATWDYIDRLDEFLDWSTRVANLLNAPAVVRRRRLRSLRRIYG